MEKDLFGARINVLKTYFLGLLDGIALTSKDLSTPYVESSAMLISP